MKKVDYLNNLNKEQQQSRIRKRRIQNYKTLFLACVTIVCFVSASIYSLEIAPRIIFAYLLGSLLLVGSIVLLAFLSNLVWRYFKNPK